MKRYFIIAGDPSGDAHGSKLINEIKKIEPQSSFYGIGGNKMVASGLKTLVPLSEIAVVGFWEVAKKYIYFRNLLNRCKSILHNDKPDAFIPIDYPGFNVRLASCAKSINVPVIYYIAPQLWAWGRHRAKKLKGNTDKLLTVLPFEVEFFAQFGIEADFVGHPLLDNAEFRHKSETERDDSIAFFPGSRLQEVRKHLSLFDYILSNSKLYKRHNFIIAKSTNLPDEIYSDFLKKFPRIKTGDNSHKILQKSKAGLIKTGTSNLEAALFGLPFAMYYKTSTLSYLIAKNLVDLEGISIVNILAGNPIIREFIQNDIKADEVERHLERLMADNELRKNMLTDFDKIRQNLGGPGASGRAAKIITGFT